MTAAVMQWNAENAEQPLQKLGNNMQSNRQAI